MHELVFLMRVLQQNDHIDSSVHPHQYTHELMIMSYHFCGPKSRLNALCGQGTATKDIEARPILDYDLLKVHFFTGGQ